MLKLDSWGGPGPVTLTSCWPGPSRPGRPPISRDPSSNRKSHVDKLAYSTLGPPIEAYPMQKGAIANGPPGFVDLYRCILRQVIAACCCYCAAAADRCCLFGRIAPREFFQPPPMRTGTSQRGGDIRPLASCPVCPLSALRPNQGILLLASQ